MADNAERTTRWRRYPPLSGAMVAMLLAVFVLPSALNVPQSNPTQTLEFAPIPADQDEPPPPRGANAESLSLGSSSSVPRADAAGAGPDTPLPPPPPLPDGAGSRPTSKRCVGDPPRQTADPMSPPCVAYFDGDNFGATHRGVAAEEIRIIVRFSGTATAGSSQGFETETPDGTYIDLWEPPRAEDGPERTFVQALRHWQRYFNERYQLYGRRAHIWVAMGDDDSPEAARARAAEHLQKIDPFAVYPHLGGYVSDYAEVMAQAGTMMFGSRGGRSAEFFQEYPGQIWSVEPHIERLAETFAAYVCRKVAPFPVSFSGGDVEHGQPRVYGIVYSHDPAFAYLEEQKRLAEAALADCGVVAVEEGTFAGGAYAEDTQGNAVEAATTMATFRDAGVTTVLWPGGVETSLSKAASALGYYPEWVTLGDLVMEGYWTSQRQAQDVWRHAWTVTPRVLQGRNSVDPACFEEYAELNPEANPDTLDYRYACVLYDTLRQLFTGVQAAGPRLTPETMDAGFHAIPAVPSSGPSVPACFYPPGDYTCVKDAIPMWWDPEAPNPNFGSSGRGCYRVPEGGLRYLPEDWPDGDVTAQRTPDDPCNGYGGELLLR